MAKTTLPREAAEAWLKLLVAPELAVQASAPAEMLSPLDWATRYATLVLPTEGRVPFVPYPYQSALLEDTAPRRLVLKARQTGLSNTIALEALHLAVTQDDRTILFVSRNQELAQQLIRYIQHTLIGCQAPMPRLKTENLSELAWANGSRIVSLPANPSTGRGIPATAVYLDEYAFCLYDQLVYESIIGTVSTGGRLTILSTPNGRGNMYFRLWEGQEGGEWSRHEIHWSDCPRYTEEWAKAKQAEMPRQSWAQEYGCDFIASGEAVFQADDLARCGDAYDPDPAACVRTITGWDIGRRHDHTVGITLGQHQDSDAWHVIAYARFLEPYPVIQARIEQRVRDFPQGKHYVESNGPGDSVIENLAVRVRPFVTTARTKVQAIQALQLLVERGHFKHAEPQLDRELSLYQWDDKALVQDSVIAAAIAADATQGPAPPKLVAPAGPTAPSRWRMG